MSALGISLACPFSSPSTSDISKVRQRQGAELFERLMRCVRCYMEKFGEQELRAPTKGQGWLPSSGGSVVCASLGITLGVLFAVFWEGQCLYWFLKG